MPVAATILDERACAGFPSIDHTYVHTHTASRFISHNHNQAKRCYVGFKNRLETCYYYYYYYYLTPVLSSQGMKKITLCNTKKYKNQAGINLTPPPPSQNSHVVRWHCTIVGPYYYYYFVSPPAQSRIIIIIIIPQTKKAEMGKYFKK